MAASTSLTDSQRVLRARLAAHARWSQEDPSANAQRGQAGLLDRFRREIITEQGDIAEPELTRRAEARRREHMTRLSFAASRARTARREQTTGLNETVTDLEQQVNAHVARIDNLVDLAESTVERLALFGGGDDAQAS